MEFFVCGELEADGVFAFAQELEKGAGAGVSAILEGDGDGGTARTFDEVGAEGECLGLVAKVALEGKWSGGCGFELEGGAAAFDGWAGGGGGPGGAFGGKGGFFLPGVKCGRGHAGSDADPVDDVVVVVSGKWFAIRALACLQGANVCDEVQTAIVIERRHEAICREVELDLCGGGRRGRRSCGGSVAGAALFEDQETGDGGDDGDAADDQGQFGFAAGWGGGLVEAG